MDIAIRQCACGAQTLLERCVVCERQEAANKMLDRIRPLLDLLGAHGQVFKQLENDSPEMNALFSVLLQDSKDAQEWWKLTTDLKLWRLHPSAPEVFEKARELADLSLELTDQMLTDAQRGRIQAVPDRKLPD